MSSEKVLFVSNSRNELSGKKNSQEINRNKDILVNNFTREEG